MHSQQPPGVVQNWSTLQCSKYDIEQCGYDHAPVTREHMRTQFLLPHGPLPQWLLKALGPQSATARKAGPIPSSAPVLQEGCTGDQPVFSFPPPPIAT